MAGTQHTRGVLPLTSTNPLDGSSGTNPFNVVDYAPLLRAALINLDRWVTEDIAPPPSVFPRLSDKTAIPVQDVIRACASWESPRSQTPAASSDFAGSISAQGQRRASAAIQRSQARPTRPMCPPWTATATNWEASGLLTSLFRWQRMPAGTRVIRQRADRDRFVDMLGSTVAFAPTVSERRLESGKTDPRPSIAERYRDRQDYLGRVRLAAEELARQRYVLDEDIDLLVNAAAERWDSFAGVGAAATSAGS